MSNYQRFSGIWVTFFLVKKYEKWNWLSRLCPESDILTNYFCRKIKIFWILFMIRRSENNKWYRSYILIFSSEFRGFDKILTATEHCVQNCLESVRRVSTGLESDWPPCMHIDQYLIVVKKHLPVVQDNKVSRTIQRRFINVFNCVIILTLSESNKNLLNKGHHSRQRSEGDTKMIFKFLAMHWSCHNIFSTHTEKMSLSKSYYFFV